MKKKQIVVYIIALFASMWIQTLDAFEGPAEYVYDVDCNNHGGWFFEADFLLWSTNFNNISGIDVGLETTESTADATIFLTHSRQSWDPGLKLAAGRSFCNNWNIQGTWTYFYNSATNSYAPFELQVNADSLQTSGGSKFTLKYNAADLDLESSFYLCPYICIRPVIGIHALWTQTNANLNLSAPALSGMSLQTDGFDVTFNSKNNNWGIGPKLGVNSDWGNFNGFSLVGNVFGALVYGQHKGQIDAEIDIISEVDITIHIVDRSYWDLMSVVQLQAGISYTCCLFQNLCRIDALWESIYINQADHMIILDNSIRIQGLTLKMGFDF